MGHKTLLFIPIHVFILATNPSFIIHLNIYHIRLIFKIVLWDMWCGLRPYVEWEGISSALTCSYLYIAENRKKPFLSKSLTKFSKELDDRIQTRPWQSIWWVENSHKALLFHLGIFLSILLCHFDFFNWIKGLAQFFDFFVTIFGSSWHSSLSPTRCLVPF